MKGSAKKRWCTKQISVIAITIDENKIKSQSNNQKSVGYKSSKQYKCFELFVTQRVTIKHLFLNLNDSKAKQPDF